MVEPGPQAGERLTGMAEAERQIRVARRLCEAGGKQAWDKMSKEQRRPYIDRACSEPHRGEHE